MLKCNSARKKFDFFIVTKRINMDINFKFISSIQSNNILYKRQQRIDSNMLHERWTLIANEFDLADGRTAMNKWNELVQGYRAYLFHSKNFEYASSMKFMQSYIMENSSESSESELDMSDADLQQLLQSDEEGRGNASNPTKFARLETPELLPHPHIEHLETSNLYSFTPLELIFLGYARTLQKMPRSVQLEAKHNIGNIMHKAEIAAESAITHSVRSVSSS